MLPLRLQSDSEIKIPLTSCEEKFERPSPNVQLYSIKAKETPAIIFVFCMLKGRDDARIF
jgi:hypothetical protein